MIASVDKGDWAGVITCATGILTSNSNNIDALVRRGKAYQERGDFLCAAGDFRKFGGIFRNDEVVLARLRSIRRFPCKYANLY